MDQYRDEGPMRAPPTHAVTHSFLGRRPTGPEGRCASNGCQKALRHYLAALPEVLVSGAAVGDDPPAASGFLGAVPIVYTWEPSGGTAVSISFYRLPHPVTSWRRFELDEEPAPDGS